MPDPLNKLHAELQSATPDADPARRAATLAEAEKIFAASQGMADAPRPMTDPARPIGRFSQGVKTMLLSLTSRGGLVVTTALVAVGLFAVLPGLPNLFTPAPEQVVEEPAPAGFDLAAETDMFVQSAPAPELRVAPAATSAKRAARPTSQPLKLSLDDVQASGATFTQAPSFGSDVYFQPEAEGEAFANADSNPLKVTSEAPVSTFSIDVDTASYGILRSSLNRGQLPPPEAVRIEELINYFPYDYPAPEDDAPFRPTVSVVPTPWNAGTNLVHIALQGELPAIEDRPALNLVFLIDTSGSMQDPAKLPLLKTAFRMMLSELRPEDEVSIVTYAGSAGQVLEPTPAADRDTILAALDQLEAGGSTAGQAGLQQAYAVAGKMREDGQISRVILATDGDFNVGLSDPEQLKTFIANKRDSGTYLSVLGFGRGNLDDATMQALAQNGNGQAAYIDTASEARKVLVDQLTGALFPIAQDVKIQVEFNPAAVAEYRLIGYETRSLKREDFNNDKVDAGEIGAGHSVTAIYEVTPVGSEARLTDPLRYGAVETDASATELGFLRLRYKAPGADDSVLIETPIGVKASPASQEAAFAIAMAGFGQVLRGREYLGDWSIGDAITLAQGNRGEDLFGYRQEAVQLMRIAESLSE